MKTFDYLCKPCNFKWEEIVTKNQSVKCPKCRCEKVRKLFASPMFHFNTISDKSLRDNNII